MKQIVTESFALLLAGVVLGQTEIKDKVNVWADAKHDKVTTQEGEVADETFKEVVIKLGPGATRSVKQEDVRDIEYQDGRELREAQKLLNGDPDTCAAAFKALLDKIKAGRSTRKIFEQHALWGYALALHNRGDLKGAAEAYGQLISGKKDTVYLYQAFEKAVECNLASKNAAGAKAVVDNLKAINPDDGGKFAMTRDFLSAWTKEAGGDPTGAKADYEKVERAAVRFPDVLQKAKVGAGRCCVGLKDSSGAEKKFKEAIDGGAKGATLVAAWNGLGSATLARADEERNPANKKPLLKAAMLAYLRSALVIMPGEGESWDGKAEAMARAGYCFEQYAETLDDPKDKNEYKNRARGMYADCVAQFGTGGGWGAWADNRNRKMR